MDEWKREKLLILGMTYPAYSKKYRENVCTGALRASTLEMVRIHPIPRRYLDMDHRFRSYQWIEADVAPHAGDPRPESLRIKPDSIVLGEVIPTQRAEARGELIRKSPHLMKSVEELLDRQKDDGTSLGIIKPQTITGFRLETRSDEEKKEWLTTEAELSKLQDLFERPPRKIDFPDVRFKVQWTCNDPSCTGHDMGLLTWGIHELWRKLKDDPDREAKTLDAMRRQMDSTSKDIYFYMGNFRGRLYQFGLMDAFSCPKRVQTMLF